MTRRLLLVTLLAVPYASSSPAEGAGGPAAVERVLLVTIDSLRADHVGASGGPVPTPMLDRLAAEGALVARAFTPIPSTGPAHASLLTGLHPWSHRTLEPADILDPRIPTLADRLSKRGLATAAFVSIRLLEPRFGFHQGFDTYSFEPTGAFSWEGRRHDRFFALGEETTRKAMRWMTSHANEPFFVWVHYFDPHLPYLPPPGFARPPNEPIDLEGASVPEPLESLAELERTVRAYRGEIAYVDFQVGQLVERLRLLGLLERTLVIATSDHGQGLGQHGVLQHSANLYDELVRVPLLVRAPGVAPGRRLDGLAQLEDVTATILAWTGVPAEVDGKDLGPWLRGEVAESPRTAVVGRRRPTRGEPDLYYVRSDTEKWIGALEDPGIVFDLATDPREFAGRPGAGPPAVLRELVARAGDGARSGPAAPATPRSPAPPVPGASPRRSKRRRRAGRVPRGARARSA